ncbi:putative Trimeric LpxA-like enzyme [Vibrio nigripulchritudo SO65]|uniref:acyltransferase n=1 Tax=Vibrio nigripulchritudo TaxID=28173 RepID=UPI0003B1BFEC|nr:acyltransferase [Vibrio nigripulchritudo]CCN36110.1 putative Trimeric LpxA-like enzyme [Vibrio nigripulchritudo AM115]CCN39903.1 putative Trimeric LpxA-like enzyme [Vibrio nigripulchritudo FTn2]CCN66478.1 putative Trimeric LpxA-like enzyme [Vibrio nigripulchritudo POn4]CCN77129.1 putative Trimeric LpxA-like enzyme [Vibrio nigripulchritudo SO65]
MTCFYENLYPMDPNSETPQVLPEFQSHLTVGETSSLIGRPHVAFTFVRDESYGASPNETGLINSDDFVGRITIGQHNQIYSQNDVAFENTPVRLTLVKANHRPAGQIDIGNHVVMQGTNIISYEKVTIEDHVSFGPRVTIMDCSGHPVTGRGEADEVERTPTAPVTIRSGAWIGIGATILKGVTIGRNAVVGANSVVYKDIPDNAIALGNPAVVVKYLEQGSDNEDAKALAAGIA